MSITSRWRRSARSSASRVWASRRAFRWSGTALGTVTAGTSTGVSCGGDTAVAVSSPSRSGAAMVEGPCTRVTPALDVTRRPEAELTVRAPELLRGRPPPVPLVEGLGPGRLPALLAGRPPSLPGLDCTARTPELVLVRPLAGPGGRAWAPIGSWAGWACHAASCSRKAGVTSTRRPSAVSSSAKRWPRSCESIAGEKRGQPE